MSELAQNTDIGITDLPEVEAPVLSLERFDFHAKVFKIKGACFLRDSLSNKAVFRVPMGSMTACIPVAKLSDSFEIDPEENDGFLLTRAEHALQHVPVIRNGDAIPTELITGQASWKYEPSHRLIAEGRLAWYLLEQAGVAVPAKPPAHLLVGFAKSAMMQEHGPSALEHIAQQNEDKSLPQLQQALDDLGHNLAYIEALKDHFVSVFQLHETFEAARIECRNEKISAEEFGRITALSLTPLHDLRKKFSQIATMLGHIEQMLLHPDSAMRNIQKIRNTLHLESQKWDPIIKDWADTPNPALNVHIRRRTYHFLASHWLAENTWSMSGQ